MRRSRTLIGAALVSAMAVASAQVQGPSFCHLARSAPYTESWPFVSAAERDHFTRTYLPALAQRAGGQPARVTYEAVNRDAGSLVVSARTLLDRDDCAVWLVPASRMRILNDPQFVRAEGSRNPFPNIDKAWKGFGGQHSGKVTYLVVGWIPKTHASKTEADGTIVIEMKSDETGFEEYAIAITSHPSTTGWNGSKAMDFVSGPQGSRLMGRYFYVVPDNTSLKRRVRIDLLDSRNGEKIGSTPCTIDHCYPKLVFGEVEYKQRNGSTGKVCGTAGACPQFSIRPERQISGAASAQREVRPQ